MESFKKISEEMWLLALGKLFVDWMKCCFLVNSYEDIIQMNNGSQLWQKG